MEPNSGSKEKFATILYTHILFNYASKINNIIEKYNNGTLDLIDVVNDVINMTDIANLQLNRLCTSEKNAVELSLVKKIIHNKNPFSDLEILKVIGESDGTLDTSIGALQSTSTEPKVAISARTNTSTSISTININPSLTKEEYESLNKLIDLCLDLNDANLFANMVSLREKLKPYVEEKNMVNVKGN